MALPMEYPGPEWAMVNAETRLVIGADTSPPDQTDVSRFSVWAVGPDGTQKLLGVFDGDKLSAISRGIEKINVANILLRARAWHPYRDANEYAAAYGWGRYAQAAGIVEAAEIIEAIDNPNGHNMHGNARPESPPDVAGYTKPSPGFVIAGDLPYSRTIKRDADNPRIGRNEKCPCCGKKRKRCPFRKQT